MQSTRHDIPFDGKNFAIFDTIGLEEPQMGVNGYLKAIEKAYELVMKLGAAGGIHLLLFCMRGGRITATTQSNYRLFCECLCGTRVPIALVFTGLERETEMEDWWTRNRTHIEGYGIKSAGHACITAVQDDTPGEDLKYTESQNRIRELLISCALKHEAFSPEPHTWFARIGRGMKSFIEKHKNPKRRDVMHVLTRRCKLDQDTARKIADMMEKGDPETKDDSGGGGAGSTEDRSNPEVGADGKDGRDVAKENPANNDTPPDQLGDVKAESHVQEVEDERRAAKNVARDHTLPNQLGVAKAEPHVEGIERKVTKKVAKNHTPPNQLGDVKAGPRTYATEGRDERDVAKKNVVKDHALSNQPGDVKPEPRIYATERKDERKAAKNVTKDHTPPNQLGDVKIESCTYVMEGRDERDATKQNLVKDHAPSNQPGDVKPEPRTYGAERIDGRKATKNVAKDHTSPDQLGDVKANLRTYAYATGRDERDIAKKNAAKEKDDAPTNQHGEAEPRIDDGQSQFGIGGDQSLGADITEQSVSSRSRQLVDPQS